MFRFKKLVFSFVVFGTLLRALEIRCLTQVEVQTLNKCWIALARKCTPESLREKYATRPQGSDIRHVLSGDVVSKIWMIPLAEIELRVRRIKRWQSFFLRLDRHTQEIAALFGRLAGHNFDTVLQDGSLHTQANPFAKQAVADIEYSKKFDDFI